MYELQMSGDALYIDGMEVEHETINVDLGNLGVLLSINEESCQPEWHCTECNAESSDDTPEVDPCPGSGNWRRCTHCGASKKRSVCEGINPGDCTLCDGSGKCDECDDAGDIEVHRWEPIPLHWVKSASIHAYPDQDRLDVSISVGDPRGGVVMSVERREDGFYLSVPHPVKTSHVELTECSPGWYRISG